MTAFAGHFREADSLAALAERHPLRHRAVIDAVRGRYREALRHLAELGELQLARDMREPAIKTALYAGRLLLASGDTAAATLHIERFLQRVPLDSLHPLGRPYLQLPLADFFIEAGNADRARSFLGPTTGRSDRSMRPRAVPPTPRTGEAGRRGW